MTPPGLGSTHRVGGRPDATRRWQLPSCIPWSCLGKSRFLESAAATRAGSAELGPAAVAPVVPTVPGGVERARGPAVVVAGGPPQTLEVLRGLSQV